jgi:hypothetical protein
MGVLYKYLVIFTEEIRWNIKSGCVCVEYVHIHFFGSRGENYFNDLERLNFGTILRHIVNLMLNVNNFTERKFKSVNRKNIELKS